MGVARRTFLRSTRRQFLKGCGGAVALTGFGGIAAPYLSRAADRPRIEGGLQSGDVSVDSAVVWGRADRSARMQVEFSTVESFASVFRVLTADALPDSDFTAKILVEGLPPDQDVFYRTSFHDIQQPLIFGDSQVGRFRTAPTQSRSVSFVSSGDVAGKVGASIPTAAACAASRPCATTPRTSSFIPATASMQTARSSAA